MTHCHSKNAKGRARRPWRLVRNEERKGLFGRDRSWRSQLGGRREGLGERGETAILFARLFHHAPGNEILQLFIRAETKHLLTATGSIPGAQTFVDDVEELLELKVGALLGQGGHQLFGHKVGKTARKRTFSLHKHERIAYHTCGVVSCKNLRPFLLYPRDHASESPSKTALRVLTRSPEAIRCTFLRMSDPAEQKTDFGEKSRAGFSFFAMFCLFGLAALFFFASGSLIFQCASVVPALLGGLLLFNGVHCLFAARTPPTTLQLSATPLRPGQSTGLVIRQEGPVLFESLRANLVCERSVRGPGKSRTVTHPCQANFFDSGPWEVPRMGSQEFRATVPVPPDAEPSLVSVELIVSWRIEVWGKVRGNADFMRPFDVEVTA